MIGNNTAAGLLSGKPDGSTWRAGQGGRRAGIVAAGYDADGGLEGISTDQKHQTSPGRMTGSSTLPQFRGSPAGRGVQQRQAGWRDVQAPDRCQGICDTVDPASAE